MRIERINVELDHGSCRAVDTGERPLGDIVLVHGGVARPDSAHSDASARLDEVLASFLRQALLQVTDPGSVATPRDAASMDTAQHGSNEAGPKSPGTPTTNAQNAHVGTVHCRTGAGRTFELSRRGQQWGLANGTGVVSAEDLGLGFPVPPADSAIVEGPKLDAWPSYRRQLTSPPVEISDVSLDIFDAPTSEVEERLQSVRDRLAESDEFEQRRDHLDESLQELRAQRARAVEMRSAARRKLRKIAQLRPVQFHVQQLERWREQAGDLELLLSLPADPGQVLEQLSSRLDALRTHETRRVRSQQELRPVIEAFGMKQLALLSNEAEIVELLEAAARIPERSARVALLEEQIEPLVAAIQAGTAEFVEDDDHVWSPDEEAALLAWP